MLQIAMALIRSAYGITNTDQISRAPTWLNTERYDVNAKAETIRRVDISR